MKALNIHGNDLRTLPTDNAYWLAAGVTGVFVSLTSSTLIGSYSPLAHFSPLTLPLIYAAYAFGMLAALLLANGGSKGDRVDPAS
jgi:hypothetical protein